MCGNNSEIFGNNQRKETEADASEIFWISLLRDVFDVEHAENFIRSEFKIASFRFDAYIPKWGVFIEQKKRGTKIELCIKKGNSIFANLLSYKKQNKDELNMRYLFICNYEQCIIYSFEEPDDEPIIVSMANLEKNDKRFSFLMNE